MALSNDDIQACARRLHQAEKTRTQIRQLSQDCPDIAIGDAYAIQKAWLPNKIAPFGLALEPGQIVLAGSFSRPIETGKRDTIQADHGAYGSVSCYFA